MKKINTLTIMLGVRKFNPLNSYLINTLSLLSDNIQVLVNYNGSRNIPEEYEFPDNVIVINTYTSSTIERTNSMMRGIANIVTTDFVMFMDDDMLIFDFVRFNNTINRVLEFMGTGPYSLARLAHNSTSMGDTITISKGVSSTSMSSGIIVSNLGNIFSTRQLSMSWRTDDYNICLNALYYGNSLTVEDSNVIHFIAGSGENLKFPFHHLESRLKENFTIEHIQGLKPLLNMEGDDVRWLDDGELLGYRSILQKIKNHLMGVEKLYLFGYEKYFLKNVFFEDKHVGDATSFYVGKPVIPMISITSTKAEYEATCKQYKGLERYFKSVTSTDGREVTLSYKDNNALNIYWAFNECL